MAKAKDTGVIVNARQFHAALTRATEGIETKKTYPILRCVHLLADGEQMQVVATDLDIRITTVLPAQGSCAAVCIDAARLIAVVGQLKDRDEIGLSFDGDAGHLTCKVSSGRSRFTLDTLPAGDFPELSFDEPAAEFALPGAMLATLMTALAPAISTEETRYYLNGIFMIPGAVDDPQRAEHLTAVATDGHRLFARHVAAPGLPADMPPMIVPRNSCRKLAKLFAEIEQVTISCTSKHFTAAAEGLEFSSKLIEGTYPDWRRVTPRGAPSFSYDTASLIRAVETAGAGVERGKTGKAVRLAFGEADTEISARDLSNPAFSAVDVCRHSLVGAATVTEIGVNAEYLAEALRHLDAETVEIAIADAGSPIALTGAALDDRRMVVMPMRV